MSWCSSWTRHESDLSYYLAHHPQSALAGLVKRGIDHAHAQTTFPSDSFPGMVAQLTGGGLLIAQDRSDSSGGGEHRDRQRLVRPSPPGS